MWNLEVTKTDAKYNKDYHEKEAMHQEKETPQ